MALNVRATLNLDGRGFATGLQRAQQGLVSFGQKLAGIFVTGYIASAIRRIGKELADIPDKAAGMGLTTDQFQALDFAAKQTGVSIEDVNRNMIRLAKSQKDAIQQGPKSDLAKAFESMGISFQELRATTPEDIAKKWEAAVAAGTLTAAQGVAMNEVLGRSWQDMFQFISAGGFATAQQFLDNNRAVEADTLEMLDSLDDAWGSFFQSIVKGTVDSVVFIGEKFKDLQDALAASFGYMLYGKEVGDALMGDWAERTAKEKEDKERRRRERTERADNMRQAKIAELGEVKQVEAKARARIQVPSDALSKIGGFTGLGGARSAEASLRKIEKNTDRAAKEAQRLNQKFTTL